MADGLPEVLNLLHDSDRRWRTLRAEGDQWADPERSRQAFMRHVPPGAVVSGRGRPGPADVDPIWKLWMAPPRFRADFGGPHHSRTLIIGDGRRVCFSKPGSDFMRVTAQPVNEEPHVGPASELLRSHVLPVALQLESVGRRRYLGREVLMVRGRPRSGAERGSLRFFMGADEVHLALDAERGIALWMEQRLDDAPFRRVAMTSVAFDDDLDAELFEFPDEPEVRESSLPVPGERRLPPAPHPRQGPPDDVLGEPVAGRTVLARSETMVVAADRIVAYPTGFEFGITIRTHDRPAHGSFDHQRQRAWAGVAAFPGESVRVTVEFADGRRGTVDNFASAPAGQVQLVPIRGHGTQTRFDQQFWVEPLPPAGPLGVVVEWERRGLAGRRAELDAGAILDAAGRAETLW
jgi:hypothetical protein